MNSGVHLVSFAIVKGLRTLLLVHFDTCKSNVRSSFSRSKNQCNKHQEWRTLNLPLPFTSQKQLCLESPFGVNIDEKKKILRHLPGT